MFESAFAGTIHLPQASSVAAGVDAVNDFIFYVSLFFTIAIPAVILFFIIKYHRSRKGRRTEQLDHSTAIEVVWTVIPLVLMLYIAYWGWEQYKIMIAEPKDAIEINVTGRQWVWNFQYTNGRQTMNEMVVPKGKAVKLIMTSEDVLHSFFIPNFRLKQDVVPGTYTSINFIATILGEHKIYCTEYCGTSHSDMLGKVLVVEEKEYNNWLTTGNLPAVSGVNKSQQKMSPVDKGKELYTSKGCIACHSTDGSPKVGPTWKGVFGHEVEMQDGSKVTVDENYLRESIENSNAKIVKGFAPSMPMYKGTLTDEEVGALVAYIKSLK